MILNISYKISRTYMFKLIGNFSETAFFYSTAIFLTDACPNPGLACIVSWNVQHQINYQTFLNFEKQKQKLKIKKFVYSSQIVQPLSQRNNLF